MRSDAPDPSSVDGSLTCHRLRLDRRSDDQQTAPRAGHRPAHEEHVVVWAHGDDREILRGDSLIAHVPRHTLVLEDTSGMRTVADRAAVAEILVRTVSGVGAAEVMALDYALITFPLAHAGDVDEIAFLEEIADLQLATDLEIASVAELPQHRDHLAGLLAVLALGLGQALRLLLAEADLHRRVPVLARCTLLHDRTRTGVDHGDRHELAALGEHLGHAELLADQS